VPWCDGCDRFLSPSTVQVDGTCPWCGRSVEPGHAHTHAHAEAQKSDAVEDDDDEDLPPIPWHLWLLAGALAVYLGYRAMQGIEWLIGTAHFH